MRQDYHNRSFVNIGFALLASAFAAPLIAMAERSAARKPATGGAPAGRQRGGAFSRGMFRTGQSWKRAYQHRKAA